MFTIVNDTAWPAGLIDLIQMAHDEQSKNESRYYGAYNKLLNYLFPNDDYRFVVCPQGPPDDGSRDAMDFVAFFVLDRKRRPIMIVEIKDDTWLLRPSKRKAADFQIRNHYTDMLGQCPLPRLWSLSIFGINARVYCGDRATGAIHPDAVIYNANYVVPDDYLENAWSLDITTQAGFDRVKQVATDIYTEIDNL